MRSMVEGASAERPLRHASRATSPAIAGEECKRSRLPTAPNARYTPAEPAKDPDRCV
jgi:hypothetical protein